jgi:hypothetical protein
MKRELTEKELEQRKLLDERLQDRKAKVGLTDSWADGIDNCDVCGEEKAKHVTHDTMVKFYKSRKVYLCDDCYDGWLNGGHDE